MTTRDDAAYRFAKAEMSEKWRKKRAMVRRLKRAKMDANSRHYTRGGALYTHEASGKVRKEVALDAHTAPTVYLCRHGSTEFNQGGVGHDKVRGWLDVPLDEKGWRDAAVLANVLSSKPLVAIFTSDLTRATDTAEEINEEHPQAELLRDTRLRSWNLGDIQGQRVSGEVIDLIKHYVGDPHDRPPDGETFDGFMKRFIDAANAILNYAKDAPGAVVMVSHARNVQLFELWVRAGHSLRDMTKTYAVNLASEPDTVKPGGYVELRYGADGWYVAGQFREQTVKATNAVS